MTIHELARKEDQLQSKVTGLYRQSQTVDTDNKLSEIFLEYKRVHQSYADLSHRDIEALKRGLFIQWYALAEPNYLTGICDLDEQAEKRIIQVLNEVIGTDNADYELIWMTNYYIDWEWIFERYSNFKGFDLTWLNARSNSLPATIDRQAMKQRGRMGDYWNSLNCFSGR